MGFTLLKDRLIVCIASSWDYDPTSKHHIAKILSKHNKIVWVNYHGSRRPVINKFDFSASVDVLCRVAGGIRRVNESIVQVTPMVIPGATHPLMQSIHKRMLIFQIRRAIRKVCGQQNMPVQVWSFAPDVPYLVGEFNEECFLYYCVDEYTQFEGFDPQYIAKAENELLKKSDIVVTTSELLHQTKSVIRPDNILIRHGVDYDHFAAAWQTQLEVPEEIKEIPRPILGYFGLIHHWIDLSLLAKVARLRPQYSFVLLGEHKVDVTELQEIPNVYLLGRKSYETLPAYCAAFDAGLMLFSRTTMTKNVNPIKMMEYLAAGLPVVSTPLPEARRYQGPITIAETADDFAIACDQVVHEKNPNRCQSISQLVSEETWQSKVEFLNETIMERLKLPGRTMSKPARIISASPIVTSGWRRRRKSTQRL